MGNRLVIVESPAKASTIAGYLGPDYVVESSVGHIRDLPDRAAEIPPSTKKAPWARSASTSTHDFEPLYVVDADKKKKLARAGAEARRTPTSSCSRRTRTARARRSPGTCSRC